MFFSGGWTQISLVVLSQSAKMAGCRALGGSGVFMVDCIILCTAPGERQEMKNPSLLALLGSPSVAGTVLHCLPL